MSWRMLRSGRGLVSGAYSRWATTSVAPWICEAAGRDCFAGEHFVDAGDESCFAGVEFSGSSARRNKRSRSSRAPLLQPIFGGPLVGEGYLLFRDDDWPERRPGPTRRAAARRSTMPSSAVRPFFCSFQGRSADDGDAAERELRAVFDLGAVLCGRLAEPNRAVERQHLLAVDHVGGVRRNEHAGEADFVVALEVDDRGSQAVQPGGIGIEGEGRGDRGEVVEIEIVRRRERRVEGGVAGEMAARVIGLQLEDADLGLGADKADVELRLANDDVGGDDGDEGRGDPGPLDAAERAEHEPVERHERDQIDRQANDDEGRAGHFDAGAVAQRIAGGVGDVAEIVPSADAARVVGRSEPALSESLASVWHLRNRAAAGIVGDLRSDSWRRRPRSRAR